MRLEIVQNENTMELAGKLDTATGPQFEKALDEIIADVSSLEIDMRSLEYISSAGLRVILKAYKAFSGKEGLTIFNVPKTVMEVFEITGFTDFLSLRPLMEKVTGTYCRRMKTSDVPAVKELISKAVADEKVQFIHEDFEKEDWLNAYDPEYFADVTEHYHAYLMFEDKTDALVASGYIKLNDDGKSAYIGMLFTDPAYRHLILGTKMLEILENDPYALETKKIVLDSSMSAYRFYQKMGYKLPNDEFEMMKDDIGYAITLEKNL